MTAELRNYGTLREPRLGIMLHYSGEARAKDAALVAWMRTGPDCRVSYNWIVCDDGDSVTIAPPEARAWHAGVCRPSDPALRYADANSAFYGIALSTGPGAPVTPLAFRTILRLCRELFRLHGWTDREAWRITGHDREAWPRGRKIDPLGPEPRHPILDVLAVRREF